MSVLKVEYADLEECDSGDTSLNRDSYANAFPAGCLDGT